MENKKLLALVLTGILAGCGGGGSSSNTDGDKSADLSGDGGGTAGSSNPLSITPWEMTDVVSKIAKIDVTNQYADTLDLCGGIEGEVIETEDFKVGFHSDNTTFVLEDLQVAAQLVQVALDENIAHTELYKEVDLGINASDKWVACYKDLKDGNGAALYPNGFEFGPESLDPESEEFESAYQLAKHELFHVIQYALFPDPAAGENHFTQYPRWFAEASAEFYAGKTKAPSAATVRDFITDTGITPYAVNNWSQEQEIEAETSGNYSSDMYRMYLSSFNYLVEHGLSFDHLVRLTEASTNIAAFDAEMAVIENELTLPTTYAKLKSSTAEYQTHVITDWMEANTVKSTYVDDITDPLDHFYIVNVETEVGVEASVDTESGTYTLPSALTDGQYEAYAITEPDEVYGPVTLTAENGTLGHIDFTGAEICTTAFCLTDD